VSMVVMISLCCSDVGDAGFERAAYATVSLPLAQVE
jgi:hypothetical protein